jgi:hypothetical protein
MFQYRCKKHFIKLKLAIALHRCKISDYDTVYIMVVTMNLFDINKCELLCKRIVVHKLHWNEFIKYKINSIDVNFDGHHFTGWTKN